MKVLELEYGYISDTDSVWLKIIRQNSKILQRGDFFKRMNNGVVIQSVACPEIYHSIKFDEIALFVQGTDRGRDNQKCFCSRDDFERIKYAVEELNNIFQYEDVYE